MLVDGTTWLEAFGDHPYCLFAADALPRAFDGWTPLLDREQAFGAPGGKVKRFAAVIARRAAMP